jgi:hypothetical protein
VQFSIEFQFTTVKAWMSLSRGQTPLPNPAGTLSLLTPLSPCTNYTGMVVDKEKIRRRIPL